MELGWARAWHHLWSLGYIRGRWSFPALLAVIESARDTVYAKCSEEGSSWKKIRAPSNEMWKMNRY